MQDNAIIISVKLSNRPVNMKVQCENMQSSYQSISRKQYTNFKQLLKLKSLKNARKYDEGRSLKANNILKDSVSNKDLQEARLNHSYFKLPIEAKSFEQINLRQSSHWTLDKSNREHVFPLIKGQQQHAGCQYTNVPIYKSNKLQSRRCFFQKNRQTGIEKLKELVSNRNKPYRYGKARQSDLSLPSKLNCRSISPLTNYGQYSQKRFPIVDQNSYQKSYCRVSSSIEKVSTRYQDIPISQFIYDQNVESSQLLQRNMQNKMQKIWRKKSRQLKEAPFHK